MTALTGGPPRIAMQTQAICHKIKECYGSFQNEQSGRGAIERRPAHWAKDSQ